MSCRLVQGLQQNTDTGQWALAPDRLLGKSKYSNLSDKGVVIRRRVKGRGADSKYLGKTRTVDRKLWRQNLSVCTRFRTLANGGSGVVGSWFI